MKKSKTLHKKTLFLTKGTWEKLAELYPDVKTSEVIRAVLDRHVDDYRKIELKEVE